MVAHYNLEGDRQVGNVDFPLFVPQRLAYHSQMSSCASSLGSDSLLATYLLQQEVSLIAISYGC